MKILMIDVGGSNIKVMHRTGGEMRKFPSGPGLTAKDMIRGVRRITHDWVYDVVSIGFPGLIKQGRPARDPLNLGENWLSFDFEKALGKPVRFINDAAMQALGNYTHGRLLFLGFGTSIGACLIADDTVIPIEIGLLRLSKKIRLMDALSKKALRAHGEKAWASSVIKSVILLQDVFHPTHTILGGGNSRLLTALPADCRLVDNRSAFKGAERLWEGADLFAVPLDTTWRILRQGDLCE